MFSLTHDAVTDISQTKPICLKKESYLQKSCVVTGGSIRVPCTMTGPCDRVHGWNYKN
jgi:hypothetical protein